MHVTLACPHCHNGLTVPAQAAGRVVACPFCGGHLAVPAMGVTVAEPLLRDETPQLPPNVPYDDHDVSTNRPAGRTRPRRSFKPFGLAGCCLGGVGLLLLGLAVVGGIMVQLDPKARRALQERQAQKAEATPTRDPIRNEIDVTSWRLKGFKTPQGQRAKRVLVTWKNTGTQPVRVVKVNVVGVDINGRAWHLIPEDWPIFSVPNSSPGVAPGETHEPDPETEGYVMFQTDEFLEAAYPKGIQLIVTKVYERDF